MRNNEQSYHNRQRFHRIQSRIVPPPSASTLILSKQAKSIDDDEEGSDKATDWESISAELLFEDEDDGLNDGEWLSDREEARIKLEQQERAYTSLIKDGKFGVDQLGQEVSTVEATSSPTKPTTTKTENMSVNNNDAAASLLDRPSPYTEEEEEIINAMGGKTRKMQRRREPGFLGDSTLSEICSDYSVPISYLADVLCMWDVPVPINIHDTLGDLVTGEQAFALVEAVNTLDVSALHDRYSNMNIQQLCYEWDIDLQQAFEMCMKEGWSLPFGVQTCLRIEQERELLRVLGSESGLVDVQDDDDDNDIY